MASIPACHAGDRGSIPRLGVLLLFAFCFCNLISSHRRFAFHSLTDCFVYQRMGSFYPQRTTIIFGRIVVNQRGRGDIRTHLLSRPTHLRCLPIPFLFVAALNNCIVSQLPHTTLVLLKPRVNKTLKSNCIMTG